MGAEFVLEILEIEKGRKPNWDAGLRKIKALGKIPYGEWPREYRECRDLDGAPRSNKRVRASHVSTLKADLADLKLAWANALRTAAKFEICHKNIVVTGGLSWGDSPTEVYDSIKRLISAGITKAMGFDW